MGMFYECLRRHRLDYALSEQISKAQAYKQAVRFNDPQLWPYVSSGPVTFSLLQSGLIVLHLGTKGFDQQSETTPRWTRWQSRHMHLCT